MVLKNAPPEFIAPQLATLVAVPPRGAGWVYEIKLAGYRILSRINGKDVRMLTRKLNADTGSIALLASTERPSARTVLHSVGSASRRPRVIGYLGPVGTFRRIYRAAFLRELGAVFGVGEMGSAGL